MTDNGRLSLIALVLVFIFALHLWFLFAVQLPQRDLQDDVYPGSEIFQVRLFGDEAHFAFIAHHLNRQGLYSIDGVHPTALRMPMFPLVLTVIYRATGENALYGIVFNCLVAALVGLAAYLLALQFWSFGTALAAMLVVGLSPYSFDNFLHHGCTPLFTLLVTVSLVLLVRLTRRPTFRDAALCGLAAGGAALTRGEGVLLILLYFCYLIYRQVRQRQKLMAVSLVFLAVALLLLAPWVVRNRLSMGYWGLSTMSGEVFAGAHNRRILDRHPGSWGRFSSFAGPEEMEKVKPLSEVELNRYQWQRAFRTLREYSLPYLAWVEVKKLFNTFKPSFRVLPKDYPGWLNLLLVTPYFCLYLLFFVWLGRTWRGDARILLLPLVVPVVVTLLFWGTIRWRIPFEPIIFTVSLGHLAGFLSRRPREAG